MYKFYIKKSFIFYRDLLCWIAEDVRDVDDEEGGGDEEEEEKKKPAVFLPRYAAHLADGETLVRLFAYV
jgi:hypothetical protein